MIETLMLASALTCHIVYSPGADWDPQLRFRHELAHCNGWTHEAPGPREPPASYVHPYAGRLIQRLMSTEDARRRCLGWEACQWFCPVGVDACPNIDLYKAGTVPEGEGD